MLQPSLVQPIAFISDIHANLPALEAVLAEIDNHSISYVLCCGDVVGYGPHPRECVELLRSRNISCVLGNHDFYVLKAIDEPELLASKEDLEHNIVWAGILHAVKNLKSEDIEWLRKLPGFLRLPDAIVGHAAMHDHHHWPYLIDSHDIIATLDELENEDFNHGFFGHTHDQQWFTRSASGKLQASVESYSRLPVTRASAVVVGSVGQPRTGDPRAAWTIWDPDTRLIEFRQTEYPIQATIDAIRAAGLPDECGLRLLEGQ